jgi:ABC-2 type transport system permease protein
METIKHYLRFTLSAFSCSIQRQLEYPLFLISWLLLIPIQSLSGLWTLQILAKQFHSISGWSFEELAFLYSLGLFSHGFAVIFFIQTWSIEDFVIGGGFDRLLVRPINPLFHFLVSGINLIGFIDLLPALIISSHAYMTLHFEWTIIRVLQLIAVILGATLIRAGIYLCLGTVAFWTKKSRPLVMGGMIMMERATAYPQTIFPYIVQVALTFIFPLGFIAFYPSTDLLGKSRTFEFITPAWIWTLSLGISIWICACGIFRVGIRRYESSGS